MSASDDNQTRVGQGSSLADRDLDRALASLTDVAPSPRLRANLMQRIAEAKVRGAEGAANARAGFRLRIALASTAVFLIAVAAWFALRSRPVVQIANTPRSHDIALPAPVEAGAGEAQVGTTAARSRPRVVSRAPEQALEPVEELPPAVPAIDLPPIPEPTPVTMTPMGVQPIEIPEIEIRPIDEPPGHTSRPFKQDPDKKPPGGRMPGAIR
jgi:hypothetical protein